MISISKNTDTPTLYGAPMHAHHMNDAFKNNIINQQEFYVLSDYSSLIFLGRRMSGLIESLGPIANNKVYAYVINTDLESKKEAISQLLARQMNGRVYEFQVSVKDNEFTAEYEKSILDSEYFGVKKFQGEFDFNHETMTIKYKSV